MAPKKAAPKKAPPPPKTRPGPPIQVYGPKPTPARAPGARYATMPPPSRPLPRVIAPATRPAPAVRPSAPVAPPAPVAPSAPARLQPVGPKSLPPSNEPIQYAPDMEVPVPEPMYDTTPEMVPEPEPISDYMPMQNPFKRGGAVKKFAKGGAVGASRRADGIAQRGKTRGRYI